MITPQRFVESVQARLMLLRSRLTNRPRVRSKAYVVQFCRIRLGGDSFFLPRYALHRPACLEFLAGRFYEPDTHACVATLLADGGGDMIHAGAFFGDMLPSFSRACAGTVYAFEPVLENYVLAKLCVEQNGLANVALFNAGLSDQLGVGRVDTGSSVHRGGGSEISDYGQPTTMISIDALDLANLSVLQLDVEGHEISALRGAERTIRRCRPVILIEDYKKLCGTLLESLGYQQSGKIPGLEIWLHASGVK